MVIHDDLPYIATDDRPIDRNGRSCGHRKCMTLGTTCRAYSDETLEVTPADEERARQLVAEGWWSTSAKRQTIRRWKERPPTVEELIRPEMLDTFHGKRLAAIIARHEHWREDVSFDRVTHAPYPDDLFEDARLSPSLFRAFKAAGGSCGR